MRIAIYDNMNQNAYIQAKVFRRAGIEADLVLEPGAYDNWAFCDPRWEELDLELPTERLGAGDLPECELPEWVRITPRAREVRWPRRNLADTVFRAAGLPRESLEVFRAAGLPGLRLAMEHEMVIRALAEYDCAIVYGMGPAYAALAGIPFLFQTWGTDITIVPFADGDGWEGQEDGMPFEGDRAWYAAAARVQRFGMSRAARVLATDPRHLPYVERLGHGGKAVHLPFLIDTEKYAPGVDAGLRERFLGERGRLLVFVPSRQNWYWKGSDKMLRGFARATEGREDVVLVAPGWGADLERSRELVRELGVAERVHLLPNAFSKTRLLRYYQAADVVMDQFTLGTYGSSALEAMSCGRPLLIHLDRSRFEGKFEEAPPVVSVREPEEIAAALVRLFDDAELRAGIGGHAREWIIDNHGPGLVGRTLELCRAAIDEAGPRRRLRSEERAGRRRAAGLLRS